MAHKTKRKFRGILTVKDANRLTRAEMNEAVEEGWLPPLGGGAMEPNINLLWAAKQSAKGSPATMTVGTKRFRWVGGDLAIARADGTEPYSDGTLFGDTVDFVNTIGGNGAPVVQGQSGAVGYLSWLGCGQEVVTGGTNATQTLTITGAPTGGTFQLQINGFISTVLNWNASAAQVQAAILGATNAAGVAWPAGTITCTGGPLPGAAVTIAFTGSLGNQPVPNMTVVNAALTGGTTPAANIAAGTLGTGFQHVATPNDSGGFYSTWVKLVGKSVQYLGQYNDCRIASLRYEGSSASKVVKLTPTLMILDPGQVITTAPTKGDDGTKPFLYTEAAGTFSIDGQIYRGHSAFAIEVQWGLSEWFGDTPLPFDVVNARATVVLQGITILLDSQGLARFNTQLYGTPTPAANARPIQTIPALGSYACTFSRTNLYTGGVSEQCAFSIPSVKWDPNLAIPANPAGGPVELPLAGEFRKAAGQPAFSVTTTTPNDAAYSS